MSENFELVKYVIGLLVFWRGQVVKALLIIGGYKIIDSGIKVGIQAGKFAATAWITRTCLNIVVHSLSNAGVVFDAFAVPFDRLVLVKGAYDIHKYLYRWGITTKWSVGEDDQGF